MPVYLRRFYTNLLVKEKQKEQKAIEKANNQNTPSNPNEVLANRFNIPKK